MAPGVVISTFLFLGVVVIAYAHATTCEDPKSPGFATIAVLWRANGILWPMIASGNGEEVAKVLSARLGVTIWFDAKYEDAVTSWRLLDRIGHVVKGLNAMAEIEWAEYNRPGSGKINIRWISDTDLWRDINEGKRGANVAAWLSTRLKVNLRFTAITAAETTLWEMEEDLPAARRRYVEHALEAMDAVVWAEEERIGYILANL